MLNGIAQLLGVTYHGETPVTEGQITGKIESLLAEVERLREEKLFDENTIELGCAVRITAVTARAEAAERERDEWKAHAKDLRAALEEIRGVLSFPDETIWVNAEGNRYAIAIAYPSDDETEYQAALLHAALARTPAQSLGRIKAAALRGLKSRVMNSHDSGDVVPWSVIEWEAERLEAE